MSPKCIFTFIENGKPHDPAGETGKRVHKIYMHPWMVTTVCGGPQACATVIGMNWLRLYYLLRIVLP